MIHEVLIDLSQKADNIINSKIGFNMDFIKRVTEKALAIVACKSLEELENISISETPRKSLKKSDHFEENKIHLHSNKNSLENESEFIKDNIMPSTQEEEVRTVNNILNVNSNTCEKLPLENTTQCVLNNYFSDKNSDSHEYQSELQGEFCYENDSSENFIKIKNVYSLNASVEISSNSPNLNFPNNSNSNFNFTYEKYQNIDIMRELVECNEEVFSKETVTVSTVTKKSCANISEEDIEVNPNRDNWEEEHNTKKNKTNEIYSDFLPTRTLQANISNSSKEASSCSNKVVSVVCESMPFDKIKNNIDDNIIQETSISNDNVTIQNFQWRKFNEEPILKSGDQTITISDSDSSNEASVETKTPPIFETSLKHATENLKNEDENAKREFLKNLSISPKFGIYKKSVVASSSEGSNSKFISDNNAFISSPLILSSSSDDYTETNSNMLNFNFIGVPINATSYENKPPKSQCLRNFSKAPKKKPNLKKNNKMFNLRSPKLLQPVTKNLQNKNENTLEEESRGEKKLKREKNETHEREKRKIRKERREKLRLSEERRMKRFEQHEEVLKRKIVDKKNKVRCQNLGKNKVSKISPENQIFESSPNAAQLSRTYSIENKLKDLSPIEPINENQQERSSSENLNFSHVYNHVHDKKLFLRQSVVLIDIAQDLPTEVLQNYSISASSLNLSSENSNRSSKTNTVQNVSIIKGSPTITKDIFPPSKNQKKRELGSTRKISTLASEYKDISIDGTRVLCGKDKNLGNALQQNSIHTKKPLFKHQGNKYTRNQISTKEKIIHQKADESIAVACNSAIENDPKLSMETSVLLNNLSNYSDKFVVNSNLKTKDKPKKAKLNILSDNVMQSSLKSAMKKPRIISKNITNSEPAQPNSTPLNKFKKAKFMSLTDSNTLNDAKLSLLKPVVVLKDISNIDSKLNPNSENKKIKEIKKTIQNSKHKVSRDYNLKKKPVHLKNDAVKKNSKEVLNFLSEKEKDSKKGKQSSDISSYEISDISDNSFVETKKTAKKVPSWATGIYLKKYLLKQYYESPDTELLFGNFRNQKAIDLENIFGTDKSFYHSRTSSANWAADESI
ncbi:INCENP_ARK-bind domain-containing protein [Caerostris darwini]|uniref:INCENP_ARK-bind domain-containing protein n=1 Tax=Caerostris darwini TaxID=1538125 RepID=A0AAV4QUF5_9ARAC|nr:INCENP_ARK-bind domain-containing protein [Caerostris darwini]